ncbi:MAG: aldehyde dehydrogenase family protein [Verrucomicrobiota bacterium]
MPTSDSRLPILKTYKLFIGGKFPRSESGRYLTAKNPRTGEYLANYCQSSRKDLRDAVKAGATALKTWSTATPYLRGQILYRTAEMLESRAEALSHELQSSAGLSPSKARKETTAAVDRLVYFAGWCDKFDQVFGSVNPVATSHFNFTVPEPSGVVAIICPDTPPLLPLVTMLSTAILAGNTVVIVPSEAYPLPAITFAEIVATSDLPPGVVNILSGVRAEIVPHIASHMEINAVLDGTSVSEYKSSLQTGIAKNLKRISSLPFDETDWFSEVAEDPYRICDTTDFKTTWHPIGV